MKKEEQTAERKSFSLPEFIIRQNHKIELAFLILLLVSLLTAPFVGVNYSLADYLPDRVQSREGLNLMEDTFGYPGTARIMIDDVTLYEAKAYKDRLEAVDGVDSITWLDSGTSVFSSDAFLNFSSLDEYYKEGSALFSVIFTEADDTKETFRALDEMMEITGEKGHFAGTSVQNKSRAENVSKQMNTIIVIGVIMIYVILTLTTTSWFEPVLYLIVMGVAIVINKGTNIFLGQISFLTDSVSAVLQLAVSMDYSIFLIHAFTREKKKGFGQQEALSNAIEEALNSIFASSLTTIVGFLVLAFMEFRIGFDLGVVLAKGIVISLLTVVFFMPAMIIRMSALIDRTAHRSFLPSFEGLSRKIFKVRRLVLILVILVAVPAYTAQSMNSFLFGEDAVSAGEGMKAYTDEQLIRQKFGYSNMMMALVPDTSSIDEKLFTDEIEDLSYVSSVTSMAGTLPEGIPEEFLPDSITEQLHKDHYSRILIYVKSKGESPLAFQYSDEIQGIMKEYYPEGSYLVGATPSTQDIKEVITKDYDRVNKLSLAGVFLVVMFSFHSVIVPFLVMIPIEVAIFINMAVPYIKGETMIFMGYVIVSCIQLGATVDYAILTTNNYLECRKEMEKAEAAVASLMRSIPAILTSGSILTIVGYTLYGISSIPAIGDMGRLIGRGALFSMILVAALMPGFLELFDAFLMDNEFERIRRFFRQRRERKKNRTETAAAVSDLEHMEHTEECIESEAGNGEEE